MLTIKGLEQAAREHADTQAALQRIARRVAALRRGAELADGFRMTRHAIAEFGKSGYGVEPDEDAYVSYPADLKVVLVELYHERWGEEIIVAFPADYLDGTEGYVDRESDAVAKRKAERDQSEAERSAKAESTAREERRGTYEQLRAEFEGDPEQVARRQRMIDLARETLAGHPQKDAESDLVLAWLANRSELHAEAVLYLAGERA